MKTSYLKTAFAPVTLAAATVAATTLATKAALLGAVASETQTGLARHLKDGYEKALGLQSSLSSAIDKTEAVREQIGQEPFQITSGLIGYLQQVTGNVKDPGAKTAMKTIVGDIVADPAVIDKYLKSFGDAFIAMKEKVADAGLDLSGMVAMVDKGESPTPAEGIIDKVTGIEQVYLGIRANVGAMHEVFTAIAAYQAGEKYRGVSCVDVATA